MFYLYLGIFRAQRAIGAAGITLHVLVFKGCLLLEVALLKQERTVIGGGWPHTGLGHVEAWAMAKTLELSPKDVVLDPMCCWDRREGLLKLEAYTA